MYPTHIKQSLEVYTTFHMDPSKLSEETQNCQYLDWQRTPPSSPSPALAFEVWPEPSDPSIPPHSDPWQLKDQFRNLRFVLVGRRSTSWGSRFLRPSQECLERQRWKLKSLNFWKLKRRTSWMNNLWAQQRGQEGLKHQLWPFFLLIRYPESLLQGLRLIRPSQECLEGKNSSSPLLLSISFPFNRICLITLFSPPRTCTISRWER